MASLAHARPAFRTSGLHPVYARALADVLEQRGFAIPDGLLDMGIGAADAQAWLPLEALDQLFATLPPDFADSDLGLALGARLQAHAHGQVGVAALASATLGDSLQVLADHARQRFSGVRWTLQRGPRRTALQMTLHAELGAARAQVGDALVEVLLALLRAQRGGLPGSLEIGMRCVDGSRAHLHASRWQTPVRYRGEQEISVSLANADLGLACLTADLETLRSALPALRRSQALAQTGVSVRVAELLVGGESGWPDARTVASRLGLSLRSLHRHLGADGSTFRGLLEARRREEALRLLRDRRVGIDQIAVELGYADAANFRRSCRRWFGRAPRELRKAGEVGACA